MLRISRVHMWSLVILIVVAVGWFERLDQYFTSRFSSSKSCVNGPISPQDSVVSPFNWPPSHRPGSWAVGGSAAASQPERPLWLHGPGGGCRTWSTEVLLGMVPLKIFNGENEWRLWSTTKFRGSFFRHINLEELCRKRRFWGSILVGNHSALGGWP